MTRTNQEQHALESKLRLSFLSYKGARDLASTLSYRLQVIADTMEGEARIGMPIKLLRPTRREIYRADLQAAQKLAFDLADKLQDSIDALREDA
jgi:hypothetical protein